MQRTILLFWIIVTVASCKLEPDEEWHFYCDRETFERERAAWEAQDMGNYTFVQNYCHYDSTGPGVDIQSMVRVGEKPYIEVVDPAALKYDIFNHQKAVEFWEEHPYLWEQYWARNPDFDAEDFWKQQIAKWYRSSTISGIYNWMAETIEGLWKSYTEKTPAQAEDGSILKEINIEIEYDSQYHYPTKFVVVYRYKKIPNGLMGIGEPTILKIKAFSPNQ